MSINTVTKARSHVGKLIVGLGASDGGPVPVGVALAVQGATWSITSSVVAGTVAGAAVFTTTITMTGVAVGDKIDVIPPAAIIAGVTWVAYVSAANTVTLRIANPTAAGIAVGTATWTVLCRKFT